MNTLIKIRENDGKRVVSAKELYDGLGYNSAVWARWYKKNIENNQFSVEGDDWVGFNTMLNGNETRDFALSLDFAKKLSMLARTERGEQIRNYFVEVEKQSASLAPRTMKEALMLAIKLEEEKEQLALEVANQKPFITAYNRVIDNAATYTLDTASDIVNLGRTKLSELLKKINWAMKDSSKGTASTRYAEELGYAKTVFDTITINGKDIPIKKIAITRKGLDKLITILN